MKIKYGINIQTFETLRREGCVYVDKTGYFTQLFEYKYYFLSRPRRFGKSLLLSTFEAFFQGKKELFEGLEIAKHEHEWTEYPVIHVDFTANDGRHINSLIDSLKEKLRKIATQYGVDATFEGGLTGEDYNIGTMFEHLIEYMHDKYERDVVVLIDEYDKFFLDVAHDPEKRDAATTAIRPFFGALKSMSKYIKFAFVTGVVGFRNTNLLLGANNLIDISMTPAYAALLGITQEELMHYFGPDVAALAAENGWEPETAIKELRDRYDGYRFTKANELVYNPLSLMSALATKELENYWIVTGATQQLKLYLEGSKLNLGELTSNPVRPSRLGSTYSTENPTSLLFQTGYLTVRDYIDGDYLLGIPNQEVQGALTELIIPEFTDVKRDNEVDGVMHKLRTAIKGGDVDAMMRTLQALLATVPYQDIDLKAQEKHLHLCFYLIFLMLGVDTKCEISQSAGRVDMVAQTPWRVYVFEYKLDQSADQALQQINSQGYAIPWQVDDRKVYKIGVEFSTASRNIEHWKYVEC